MNSTLSFPLYLYVPAREKGNLMKTAVKSVLIPADLLSQIDQTIEGSVTVASRAHAIRIAISQWIEASRTK